MRLVPSSESGQAVRLGGVVPSLGAAASLAAAAVALSLLIASVFGARVWPGGPSDGPGSGSLRLPAGSGPARVGVPRAAATAAPQRSRPAPATARPAATARPGS